MRARALKIKCPAHTRGATAYKGKMHVLLSVGNAPGFHTGYGGQALLLLRAILANERNSATVLAWNFSVSGPRAMHPTPTADFVKAVPAMAAVLDALPPREREAWRTRVTWMGNWYPKFPAPIVKAHLNVAIMNARADLFLCLQDIFMFQPGAFACPAAVWMPLHFLPAEKATVRALSDFDVLVGISGYGAELLGLLFGAHHGAPAMKHVEWVPHGRPAAMFKPGPHQLDASDRGVALHRAYKVALRHRLGWPVLSAGAGAADAPPGWADGAGGDGAVHITLLVASNSEESGRKAYDAQLAAWVAFADSRERAGYPRDATFLVLHAETARAYDLGRLLETLGEFPERPLYEDVADRKGATKPDALAGIRGARFLIAPPSKLGATSDADMAAMFQAADVLLAASTSEGCGVPILEAQLCGCPVVTNATTAMPEQTLLGVAAPAGQYIARMDFNSGWFLPDVKAVAAALGVVATWTDAERAAKAAAAVPRVVARYDDAPVVAAWDNLFGRVARDIVAPWRAALEIAVKTELVPIIPHTVPHTVPQPTEPWLAPDFAAWLRSTAKTLRVAMPPTRAVALVAAHALAEHDVAAATAAAELAALRVARTALAARLRYVQAAIDELEHTRQHMCKHMCKALG